MRLKQTLQQLLALTMLSSLCLPLSAESQGDYLDNALFKKFLETVTTEDGHDRQQILTLFKDAKRKESILKAIARPAEKTLTWGKYRKIFITESRIKKGLAFYKTHKNTLERAAKQYGVPPEIILAIIGVETRYGQNKGSYRIVDALSTLAFDYPPRSKFFTKQLREYLLLEKEAGINLSTATGSYAGAMGFPQFIPSSYRHYAVDFDNDNKIDLINNPTDAIGSVANYFKVHGWKTDAPITSPATFIKSHNRESELDKLVNQSLKPKHTVKDFTAAGLKTTATLPASAKATAMRLKRNNKNEYWIGLENFYVITRYNHSKLYAMAVFQLSEALEKQLNNN